MYPATVTDPIREQTRAMGVAELTTPEQVDEALARPGTTLLLVNSVCGCAAGAARPGLQLALAQAAVKPAQVVSVFAGVDGEATTRARSRLVGQPSSSPSIALLKDGGLVHMLHRKDIQGRSPEEIADLLVAAFTAHG
jgi:putative YphP/YqiW family bacilliredoxin